MTATLNLKKSIDITDLWLKCEFNQIKGKIKRGSIHNSRKIKYDIICSLTLV